MNVRLDTELIASYREELDSVWGIRPAEWPAEIDKRLGPEERKAWHRFMRVLDHDDRAHRRFYDWLTTERRVGAVHSFKWAEILVSGTFAAAVVQSLSPNRVLDLGCNVGYWSIWMARQHEVHAIDRSKPAVEMARRRAAELGSRATFDQEDFLADPVPEDRFDCVVSLQGVSHEIAKQNFDAIRAAARYVRPGGYLVMVEADWLAPAVGPDIDKAFHGAGLSLLWVTQCAGLGFGRSTFNYVAMIARNDGAGRGSIRPYYDESWWQRFGAWVETIPTRDWDRANSAYYWSEHPGDILRRAGAAPVASSPTR